MVVRDEGRETHRGRGRVFDCGVDSDRRRPLCLGLAIALQDGAGDWWRGPFRALGQAGWS
jgi:hypothetical protein